MVIRPGIYVIYRLGLVTTQSGVVEALLVEVLD
jgi:hypothetical protein